MPLYDYACTQCGRVHEVRHGFDETHTGVCEACGAPLRRVFNPAPVLFKGSGFYVTDSRRTSSASKPEKPAEAPAETSSPSSDKKSGSTQSESAA
jgi:putative FmdB family regulatory protein